MRLQQSGREARDKQSDSLRQKYAPKIAALQDRIRRAGQMVERQQAESRSSQMQAAISVGASILGAFLGRKTISATNIGRATTAIRGAGRAIKESGDVGQAEENVSALQQQLADLEAQFKTETDALAAATDPLNEKLETVSLKPTKANITVKLVALAWTPHWRDEAAQRYQPDPGSMNGGRGRSARVRGRRKERDRCGDLKAEVFGPSAFPTLQPAAGLP